MMEMTEPWNTSKGKLMNRCGGSPRGRSMLELTKLKRIGDRKNALDIKMQNLEFAFLDSRLAFVLYLLTQFPFFCFGMVIYIQCHYMLNVLNFKPRANG